MANHAHGLWGYVGTAPDGEPLTIQSTGVGGPSAALVLGDLAALGLRTAVRVGVARGDAVPGSSLVVTAVSGDDGTSRTLGGPAPLDPELTAALRERFNGDAELRSYDLAVAAGGDGLGDLEGAALSAAARAGGVRLGCVAVVAGDLADDDLLAAQVRAAETAVEVLLT